MQEPLRNGRKYDRSCVTKSTKFPFSSKREFEAKPTKNHTHHASTLDSIEQDIFRLKEALHNTISKYDLDKKENKTSGNFFKKEEQKPRPQQQSEKVKLAIAPKENKRARIVTINFDKSTSNIQRQKQKIKTTEKKIS